MSHLNNDSEKKKCDEGVRDCLLAPGSKLSWFEQNETMDDNVVVDDLLRDCVSPGSYLKLIGETLECELCRSVNKNVTLGNGCSNHPMMAHSLSDNDNEDEIEELAVKCYDSDSEIEVSKKKFRGGKMKKPIVVLERTTRSNKHY